MNKVKIIEMMDNRINNIDMNNPSVATKYWEDLSSEFNGTESEIINFLNSMDDDTLGWASEVFDDIYEKLNCSETFVDALYDLQKRRPNVDLALGSRD